jgi:hypothetical protein
MSALRTFLSRLRGLFGGSRRDHELATEIERHIEEATEENIRRGLLPPEARRAALARFGGVTQTMEAHRERRGFTFFSTLRQDLHYAVRTLVRAPGFALVAILTLAIGILGNTTIFSGVNALLFTPLPTEHPEQVAQVLAGAHLGGERVDYRFAKHTYKLFTALRDNNSSFVALAAIKDVTVPISETAQGARTEQHTGVARGEVASGVYFNMLGVRAAHGRVFTPDEDRTPNAHPVVVISDRLWRTHFNVDPETLGRVTYLNGHPFTIIGILPATFTGTVFANETDFWAPLMMQGQLGDDPNWFRPEGRRPRAIVVMCAKKAGGEENCAPPREQGDLRVLGRLKADVTAEAASAQLTAIRRHDTNDRPRKALTASQHRRRRGARGKTREQSSASAPNRDAGALRVSARLAHRRRQCRQSVSGASDGEAPRDRDPARDGRRTLESGAPVADGKHATGPHGGNAGRDAHVLDRGDSRGENP